MNTNPDVQPKVRLVATDLDGTLLRSDGTVSDRTLTTLARVRAAGVVLVLITARPPRVVSTLARAMGIDGLAICCNGALIYDLDTETVIRHLPLAAADAHRFITTLRIMAPDVRFAVETGLTFGYEPEYLSSHPSSPPDLPRIADGLTLSAHGVTKLIVQHPVVPLADLLRLVQATIGDTAVATHSGAGFVEVSATGVTKATALAALCTALGISSPHVVAFGDMPNDIPMLAWAGRSYAVANAHPDVLAAAGRITPANDADGVAATLDTLIGPLASPD